ncbi:MAG: hypothetical protein PF795_04350, partial [Kiritimatiellae bacterium]|nr:hypothetical protein [Kiritimatiellia bacterium]
MKFLIRSTLISLLLLSLSHRAWGQDDTRDRLSGSRRTQAEIRAAMNQLVEKIDVILFEFTRNNIDGPEVRELTQTRKLLTEANVEQMEQIMKFLDSAVQGQDQEKALLSAFEGQKNILTMMRTLMSEYNQKRDIAAIPLLIEELITRQEMNLRATRQVADNSNSKGVSTYQESLVNAQFEEQRDINQEFDHVVSSMEMLAFSEKNDVAEQYRNSLVRIQQLRIREHLTGSLDALDQKQVNSAMVFETKAVESFKQFLATLGKGDGSKTSTAASEDSPDLMSELHVVLEEQIKVRESMVKRLEKGHHLKSQSDMQGEVLVRFYGLRDRVMQEMPEHQPLHTTILDTMRLARREMLESESERPRSLQTVEKVIRQLEQFIKTTEATLAEKENETTELDLETFIERLEIVVNYQEELLKLTRERERQGASLRGLQTQQNRLAAMTEALHKASGISFPNVTRPLFDALGAMNESLQSIPVEGREGVVLLAQERALQNLREALALLESQLPEPAGEEPPPTPEELADKVKEALDNVEQAEEAIENADLDKASEKLAEAGKNLEEAQEIVDEQGEDVPENVLEDLEKAQAAMEEAVEAIEGMREPPEVAGEDSPEPPAGEEAPGEEVAGGEEPVPPPGEEAPGEEVAGGEKPVPPPGEEAPGEEVAGGEEPGEEGAGEEPGEEMAGAEAAEGEEPGAEAAGEEP